MVICVILATQNVCHVHIFFKYFMHMLCAFMYMLLGMIEWNDHNNNYRILTGVERRRGVVWASSRSSDDMTTDVYTHVLMIFLYWHTLHLTSQHHWNVQLHRSDTSTWWVL